MNILRFEFRGIRIMAERMVQPIYHLDFIWKLTKSYQKLQKYHKFGRDIFNKVPQDLIV